jgi:hypothetical protein
VYAPKDSEQSIKNFSFSHLLVFLVLHRCFTHLCCFEVKSNRLSLTRQGLTLFHVSHQVFVRINFGDPAGDEVHVLIVSPCFTK